MLDLTFIVEEGEEGGGQRLLVIFHVFFLQYTINANFLQKNPRISIPIFQLNLTMKIKEMILK